MNGLGGLSDVAGQEFSLGLGSAKGSHIWLRPPPPWDGQRVGVNLY